MAYPVKQIGLRLAILTFVGWLLLVGCNAQSYATSTLVLPSPTSTEESGSAMTSTPQLTDVTFVHIQDDWTGLSPLAPINSDYSLTSVPQGLSGYANFSVGGYTSESKRTAVTNISIPEEATTRFLKALAGIPVQKGNYVPKQTHTDDYPTISIEVDTASQGSMFFMTQSQDDDNVPWSVNHDYIINSDAPSQALAILQPYLKSDLLDNLKKQVLDGKP